MLFVNVRMCECVYVSLSAKGSEQARRVGFGALGETLVESLSRCWRSLCKGFLVSLVVFLSISVVQVSGVCLPARGAAHLIV